MTLFTFPTLLFSANTTVVFGCDEAYPPLSSFVGGEPVGFDIDLIARLGATSGFHSLVRPGEWESVLEALRSGEISAVSGILKMPSREKEFDFTIPYLSEPYAIFYRKGSGIRDRADLDGKRLAVLRGDAVIEAFIKPDLRPGSIYETRTSEGALSRVADGSADFTVVPYTLGMFFQETRGNGAVAELGRCVYTADYRIAVRKGNAKLLSVLNDGILAATEDGYLDKLRTRWRFRQPFDLTDAFPESRLSWILYAFIVIALAALSYSAFFSLRFERKKVRRLSADLTLLTAVVDAVPYKLLWLGVGDSVLGSNRAFRKAELDPDRIAWDHVDFFLVDGTPVRFGYAEGPRGRRFRASSNTLPVADGTAGQLLLFEDWTEQTYLIETQKELISQIAEKNALVRELEITDHLSGLLDRSSLYVRLPVAVEGGEGAVRPFAVLFILVDALDRLNDEKGYAAGDAEIGRVGGVLKGLCRPGDIAGRVAGGLFVMVLPYTSIEAVDHILGVTLDALKAKSPPQVSFRCVCREFSEGDPAVVFSRPLRDSGPQ